MSEVVFEAFKFNQKLEAILTAPLEADFRLRGKVEPKLPGSSLESRAPFTEKLVNGDPNFFPINAFQVKTEERPAIDSQNLVFLGPFLALLKTVSHHLRGRNIKNRGKTPIKP